MDAIAAEVGSKADANVTKALEEFRAGIEDMRAELRRGQELGHSQIANLHDAVVARLAEVETKTLLGLDRASTQLDTVSDPTRTLLGRSVVALHTRSLQVEAKLEALTRFPAAPSTSLPEDTGAPPRAEQVPVPRRPAKHVIFFDGELNPDLGPAASRLHALRSSLDGSDPQVPAPVSVWIERSRRSRRRGWDDDGLGSIDRAIRALAPADALILGQERYWEIMRGGTRSIDTQSPEDFLAVRHALDQAFRADVLLILTSYGPDPSDPHDPAHWKAKGGPGDLIDRLDQAQHSIERIAFGTAPVLIFPNRAIVAHYADRHAELARRLDGKSVHVLAEQPGHHEDASPAASYLGLVTGILSTQGIV